MDTIADIAVSLFSYEHALSINSVKRALCVGGDDDDVSVCQLCFTYLFRGPVTLSTSTHRHYNESVHRNKQHTRGNSAIP